MRTLVGKEDGPVGYLKDRNGVINIYPTTEEVTNQITRLGWKPKAPSLYLTCDREPPPDDGEDEYGMY